MGAKQKLLFRRNNPQPQSSESFKEFWNNVIEKRRKLLEESPNKITDYNREEIESQYDPRRLPNMELLSELKHNTEIFHIRVDSQRQEIYILNAKTNEWAGEFLFSQSNQKLETDFPLQNEKYPGIIRATYIHLLRKNYCNSIYSGRDQTPKAFTMWKKLSETSNMQVSVHDSKNNTLTPLTTEELELYWGEGQNNFRFVLTLS